MPDATSPQIWMIACLAAMAIAPASYVWRHVAAVTAARDITQPPDDLSWRTSKRLYRSLAVLAGLVAVGVFLLTPVAVNIAQSEAFAPAILGAIGGYALTTAGQGWRKGQIEPLVRGLSITFDRAEQPLRYWISLLWNAALGIGLTVGSLGIFHEIITPRCDDVGDTAELVEAIQACNTRLAEAGPGEQQRAVLLSARGRIHHRLDNNDHALADYSAALEINPADSFALYNRAEIYRRMGKLREAIDDYSASLRLRPENTPAYLNRGLAYLDTGAFAPAISDFTTLHQRDPANLYALPNRGIAHAWLGSDDLAEKDFETVKPADPGWPTVLRGRAVMAMHDQDYALAIDYLTQALTIDPNDLFSLRMRGDAYWRAGQEDLARDDDDRLWDFNQRQLQQRAD